jgi:hypothetical protein
VPGTRSACSMAAAVRKLNHGIICAQLLVSTVREVVKGLLLSIRKRRNS